MSYPDMQRGLTTLRADRNWREAGLWLSLRVLAFGTRQRVRHLDKWLTLIWLEDEPYLVWISEARA